MRAPGNDINDGISSGGVADGGTSEKPRESMPVGKASTSFEADAAVPHYLAMMLREELDVSCRLGRHAAARGDERMENNEDCGVREAEGHGSSADFLGTDE